MNTSSIFLEGKRLKRVFLIGYHLKEVDKKGFYIRAVGSYPGGQKKKLIF